MIKINGVKTLDTKQGKFTITGVAITSTDTNGVATIVTDDLVPQNVADANKKAREQIISFRRNVVNPPGTKLTCKTGKNNFGLTYRFPHFGKTLSYNVTFDASFYTGPVTNCGYGMKLPALGGFNYHYGGANWAVATELVGSAYKLYVWPRYYYKITALPMLLTELTAFRFEVPVNTTKKLTVYINAGTAHWSVDGTEICSASVGDVPTTWIESAWIGTSGTEVREENATPAQKCGAARKLTMWLQYL